MSSGYPGDFGGAFGMEPAVNENTARITVLSREVGDLCVKLGRNRDKLAEVSMEYDCDYDNIDSRLFTLEYQVMFLVATLLASTASIGLVVVLTAL